MYRAEIHGVKETKDGTWIKVLIPRESVTDEINRLTGEETNLGAVVAFKDRELRTDRQKNTIFALCRSIAQWQGEFFPEVTRGYLKDRYCEAMEEEPFSLSLGKENCATKSQARRFIAFLLDFCLGEAIPMQEKALHLLDDESIPQYLYLCMKHHRCAVCGREGETHHVDAIGMGRDRKRYNDSSHKKICLCREHHSEAHQGAFRAFAEKYHVYGILYEEESH